MERSVLHFLLDVPMSFERLNSLHKKLSQRIKQYENTLNTMPPPEVLNEIRYSFRALMEVRELELSNASYDELSLAYRKAIHALFCAYHDLIDGVAIDLSSILEKFNLDYFEEFIVVSGSKRIEIIDLLNAVTEIMATSRSEHSQREVLYDEELYDNYFEQMLNYRVYLLSQAAEDIVRLNIENKRKRYKNYSLAVVGILVSLVGVYIGM